MIHAALSQTCVTDVLNITIMNDKTALGELQGSVGGQSYGMGNVMNWAYLELHWLR